MIRLKNVKTPVSSHANLYLVAAKKLGVDKNEIKNVLIRKRSIDARDKHKFSYVFDLDVEIDNESKYIKKDVTLALKEEYEVPYLQGAEETRRPIIVGAGPAGLFCAYMLAKYGYKPVIFERGKRVEDRIKDVDALFRDNKFLANSNVQFGEGGAGTFSDGKLNTLVKDKSFRKKKVLEIFVRFGAPEEIMYDSKPHIGTDVLRKVIVNMRNEIICLGGEFHFNSLVTNLLVDNGVVKGIVASGEEFLSDVVVLAIGHSARDTFKMLSSCEVSLESKPFAVGVRIIHPQKLIDENQYPEKYSFLPPASYKLTYKCKNGLGVYSFCMCPGGYVVNARSTENGVCTNGMSNYDRSSGFANSAIIATVDKKIYGDGLWAGVNFQESVEQKAYKLTSGKMVLQKFGDYKNKRVSDNFDVAGILGKVAPANIHDIFPKVVNDALIEGIDYFGEKIKGFNESDAILVAPETRSSSPIRILRDENMESNIKGLYPIGEGSGYAGGITTSAIDGIKVFEVIYKKYKSVL